MAISVVDKRNLALMRNNEMHEMGVANIGCGKHTKCPPEFDSGAFSKIRFWNEGEAPDQVSKGAGRCDGKEGQYIKTTCVVGKRNRR